RRRLVARACVACALAAAGCEDGSRSAPGTRPTPADATARSPASHGRSGSATQASPGPSAPATSATAADGGPLDRASAACRHACERERLCDLAGAEVGAEVARLVRESHRLCQEQCELEAEMPPEELAGVTERREACLARSCPELEPCLAALRSP
ncbi:MAG: hypothetical protein IT373_07600, partial [Polyangiaceae bacterium]|nr:hypothetical protein [Polyangiaceae bacterium]